MPVNVKAMLTEYFDMNDDEFAAEWSKLTTRDKLDLTKAIKGPMTY